MTQSVTRITPKQQRSNALLLKLQSLFASNKPRKYLNPHRAAKDRSRGGQSVMNGRCPAFGRPGEKFVEVKVENLTKMKVS